MMISAILIPAFPIIFFIIQKIFRYIQNENARKRAGCLPAVRYPNKDPLLGFDLFRAWLQAESDGKTLPFFAELHEKHGRTYEVKMCSATQIHTCDPENNQAVSSTQFDDFGFGPLRGDLAAPFIGRGFVTEDGDFWKSGRMIVKPAFEKSQIADISAFKRHVENFLKQIPEQGETFDMQDLTERLFFDSDTEYLFGRSMDSLATKEPPVESTEFLQAFDRALLNLGLRLLASRLSFLLSLDPGYKPAYTTVHAFADQMIKEAIERKESGRNKTSKGFGKLILLDSLVEHIKDPVHVRDNILGLFMASRGNSGPATANAFWHLAQNPTWWKALRDEALSLDEETLTFEKLKTLQVTRAIVNETLRIQSPVLRTQKAALKDTMLPRGGGPDGQAPLFVPKGRVVTINHYCVQRDKESWGPTADTFDPQRWLNKDRPKWESKWQYAPFGGTGARMCLAQNQVVMQMSYVLVRVARQFEACEFRDEVGEFEAVSRIAISSRRGVRIGLVGKV